MTPTWVPAYSPFQPAPRGSGRRQLDNSLSSTYASRRRHHIGRLIEYDAARRHAIDPLPIAVDYSFTRFVSLSCERSCREASSMRTSPAPRTYNRLIKYQSKHTCARILY